MSSPILAGPFPPPDHGVSVINSKLYALLSAAGAHVTRIDLSSGQHRRNSLHHASRATRVICGLRTLVQTSLRHETSVVLLSLDGGHGLIYNLVFVLAARLLRTPVILYHHSTRYIAHRSLVMWLLLEASSRLTIHTFCSADMASLFEERYSWSTRRLIVSNCAWIDRDDHQLIPVMRSKVVLGHLGGLCREKGLEQTISTHRQTRETGLEALLVLAGPLLDQDAEDILAKAVQEFPDSLIWLGPITGKEKADFFEEIDFFLFPSKYRHETQSLVVPEALAAGVPVIAFDHRFVPELVTPDGGLIVDINADFAREAANWITSTLQSGMLYHRKLAARSQFTYLKRSSEKQLEQLIDVLTGQAASR